MDSSAMQWPCVAKRAGFTKQGWTCVTRRAPAQSAAPISSHPAAPSFPAPTFRTSSYGALPAMDTNTKLLFDEMMERISEALHRGFAKLNATMDKHIAKLGAPTGATPRGDGILTPSARFSMAETKAVEGIDDIEILAATADLDGKLTTPVLHRIHIEYSACDDLAIVLSAHHRTADARRLEKDTVESTLIAVKLDQPALKFLDLHDFKGVNPDELEEDCEGNLANLDSLAPPPSPSQQYVDGDVVLAARGCLRAERGSREAPPPDPPPWPPPHPASSRDPSPQPGWPPSSTAEQCPVPLSAPLPTPHLFRCTVTNGRVDNLGGSLVDRTWLILWHKHQIDFGVVRKLLEEDVALVNARNEWSDEERAPVCELPLSGRAPLFISDIYTRNGTNHRFGSFLDRYALLHQIMRALPGLVIFVGAFPSDAASIPADFAAGHVAPVTKFAGVELQAAGGVSSSGPSFYSVARSCTAARTTAFRMACTSCGCLRICFWVLQRACPEHEPPAFHVRHPGAQLPGALPRLGQVQVQRMVKDVTVADVMQLLLLDTLGKISKLGLARKLFEEMSMTSRAIFFLTVAFLSQGVHHTRQALGLAVADQAAGYFLCWATVVLRAVAEHAGQAAPRVAVPLLQHIDHILRGAAAAWSTLDVFDIEFVKLKLKLTSHDPQDPLHISPLGMWVDCVMRLSSSCLRTSRLARRGEC